MVKRGSSGPFQVNSLERSLVNPGLTVLAYSHLHTEHQSQLSGLKELVYKEGGPLHRAPDI